jgi:hypothetical protein
VTGIGLFVAEMPVREDNGNLQTKLFLKAIDLTDKMTTMTEEAIKGYAVDEMHIMMNHLVDQQIPEHILI